MKYLTVDFGSTYTKLTAIDGVNGIILGSSSAFTTIETDIMNGFNTAFSKLEDSIGTFKYDEFLCCSSAGGGLKMVALGLVPELTAKAAKMAASSAGAKVVKSYSYEISQTEQDEIKSIKPDLILLCGGTDGGNKDVIIANASRLCDIEADFSIIVAGNKSASYQLEEVLKRSNKDYVITKNVMPSFNKLDIEPAKSCIRELFIKKIIYAKGLSNIEKMTNNEIIPTPLAVMKGCELLSKGIGKSSGIGEFIAIDIGGATTDIYSMAKGSPVMENVLIKGLLEPFSKRTVEGDLGMRYSLKSLHDEVDLERLSEKLNVDKDIVVKWVLKCVENPWVLAELGSIEYVIDEELGRCAIEIAAQRHAGILESRYTPIGEVYTLNGKDLSDVPYIIGTGGILVNSSNPVSILEGAKFNLSHYNYALPKNPKYLLDKSYIFSSMGLISMINPDLALQIMKKEIRLIQ